MNILKGQIYNICLDPVIGHEISGKERPAVVISNNRQNEKCATITVIPITEYEGKLHFAEVFLPKGCGNLTKDSRAKCHQLRSVDKNLRIKSFRGTINEDNLHEIELSIKFHLGIDTEEDRLEYFKLGKILSAGKKENK